MTALVFKRSTGQGSDEECYGLEDERKRWSLGQSVCGVYGLERPSITECACKRAVHVPHFGTPIASDFVSCNLGLNEEGGSQSDPLILVRIVGPTSN